MKVKIGNRTHDSETEPIMVELNDSDKKNIASMQPSCTKYIDYPTGKYPYDLIDKWADNEEDYGAPIDYKALLEKYILYVERAEGYDHIRNQPMGNFVMTDNKFTDEEWEELERISKKVGNQ